MTIDTKTDLRNQAVKIEAAICRRLRYLADKHGMQLDWEVTFFAGNLGPPMPGEDWTFTFSSSGNKQTATLTELQLVEFRHGRPEAVDKDILAALFRLK